MVVVKIPHPVQPLTVSVRWSRQKGHRLVGSGGHGQAMPAKALLSVPKAKMPLDPTVALVKV